MTPLFTRSAARYARDSPGAKARMADGGQHAPAAEQPAAPAPAAAAAPAPAVPKSDWVPVTLSDPLPKKAGDAGACARRVNRSSFGSVIWWCARSGHR
jgi:hypothetical protein